MAVVLDSSPDPVAAPRSRAASLVALLSAVREQQGQFTAQQQISDEVIALMKEAGVYRALVARRFGGDECAPMDFLRLVETISMADGSAGWVASFGFAAIYLAALPLPTLECIYADGPDVIFAGGIFPPQKTRTVSGGVEVSGRWSWGSGCPAADLIGVGVQVEGGASTGGLPRTAVMRRHQVSVVPNWEVNGLKGTGSHDIVVDRVVVPEAWTFIRGGKPTLDTPLFRYPTMALAAQVLAVVALGVGRAALDDITALAGGRASITGAPVLADRAYVQSELAKAEAALRGARAFFYEATETAYAALLDGNPVDVQQRNLLRLSSSHAAKVGADAAQTAYRLSGTTGIFSRHSIARRFQDALIVPQHAFLSEGTWQSAGRVLLGLDTPAGFP
jgi:alkylation response protein AidB-like acyl-CoA dehydrogenase